MLNQFLNGFLLVFVVFIWLIQMSVHTAIKQMDYAEIPYSTRLKAGYTMQTRK